MVRLVLFAVRHLDAATCREGVVEVTERVAAFDEAAIGL